jgi:hypothetical protein
MISPSIICSRNAPLTKWAAVESTLAECNKNGTGYADCRVWRQSAMFFFVKSAFPSLHFSFRTA